MPNKESEDVGASSKYFETVLKVLPVLAYSYRSQNQSNSWNHYLHCRHYME